MPSDNTEARRERVRSLWLKSDRVIAEILIEEGFAGEAKRTPEGRASKLATMITQVWRDRRSLRAKWREMKRIESADVHESRGEHLATLDSLQEMGVEMLADPKLKGTPKAQALQAVTRIIEAKGKALGVAELAPQQTEDEKSALPIVGVIVGARSVGEETRKQLRDHGIELDEEEGDDKGPVAAVRAKRRRPGAHRPRSKT